MIAIGVDPGITGAIAFLGLDWGEIHDMPSNPRDLYDILALPRGEPVAAWVEQAQAMPKQGVVSTFKTGFGYGTIIGLLAGLGIPYETVRPAVWKKQMGLIGKDKEESRALARQLWPDLPLGLKKHHGRAEALLIARYGLGLP